MVTVFCNNVPLGKVSHCRDLGVTVCDSLKWSLHCATVAQKASRVLGIIFRCFNLKLVKPYVRAYVAYVRPILEFNSQVWNPSYAADVETIEKVQRLFSRRVFLRCGIVNCSYEERLLFLGLDSLSYRRRIYDLCLCYTMFHSPSSCTTLLTVSHRHTHRLVSEYSRVNCRYHFLPQRVASDWNYLPHAVITSPTVHVFKRKIRDFLR